MIIAVDFDGTIVTHEYPEIGKPVPGAISTLKALIENGHQVFLWTMRGNAKDVYTQRDTLKEALDWLKDRGVDIEGNYSPEQFSTSPKQYAKLYIDDASFGCPLLYVPGKRPFVNWEPIVLEFQRYRVITPIQGTKILEEIRELRGF